MPQNAALWAEQYSTLKSGLWEKWGAFFSQFSPPTLALSPQSEYDSKRARAQLFDRVFTRGSGQRSCVGLFAGTKEEVVWLLGMFLVGSLLVEKGLR